MAIFGGNLMEAGKEIYYLRYRNRNRVKIIMKGIGLISMIGKIFVSVSASFIIYYFIIMRENDFFNNTFSNVEIKIGPPLIMFYFSYLAS